MRLAEQLVSYLLELNVINTAELDSLLRKVSARLRYKPYRDWFMRVLRFHVHNMDELADAGVRLPPSFSRYIAFKEPGRLHDPEARTGLFRKTIRSEIGNVYEPYSPKKVQRGDEVPGVTPPRKPPEWAGEMEKRGDTLLHFRRPTDVTAFVQGLENVVDLLNATPPDTELGGSLVRMRKNDTDGFNRVWVEAQSRAFDVQNSPWKFARSKLGMEPRRFHDLQLLPMVGTSPTTVKTLARYSQPTAWCTKSESTARNYLSRGPMYLVLKKGTPYALIAPEDGGANLNVERPGGSREQPHITAAVSAEIAPLFVGLPLTNSHHGSLIRMLADAVREVPPEVAAEVIATDENGIPKKRTIRKPLPPWQDEPASDTGYRPSAWEK